MRVQSEFFDFIPLIHSVYWGALADPLIGGTFAETILTLVFLPAMYSIWFKINQALHTSHTHSNLLHKEKI